MTTLASGLRSTADRTEEASGSLATKQSESATLRMEPARRERLCKSIAAAMAFSSWSEPRVLKTAITLSLLARYTVQGKILVEVTN